MFKAFPDVAPDLSTYKQSLTAPMLRCYQRTDIYTLSCAPLAPRRLHIAVWTPDSHGLSRLSWHSIHAIAYELEYAAGVLSIRPSSFKPPPQALCVGQPGRPDMKRPPAPP